MNYAIKCSADIHVIIVVIIQKNVSGLNREILKIAIQHNKTAPMIAVQWKTVQWTLLQSKCVSQASIAIVLVY